MSGDVDYPQGCLPILDSPKASISQQIERLRQLADCLYDCKPNNDDEVKQPNRFRKLFVHLSSDYFLSNSNSDFRIYLSICLANILRVFLPEIPTVTALDLKEVYLYLFRTLRGLGEITTDSPKFNNYFHLIEAIEKILHPMSEMKDHDEKEAVPVFRTLIKEILYIPCGKGWQKSVESARRQEEDVEEEDDEDEEAGLKIRNKLVSIACSALSELEVIPNEVLDVLFYHIISPQRSNFVEARLLAEDIIRTCRIEENNSLTSNIRELVGSLVNQAKLPDEFELTGSNSRKKYFELLKCLHHIDYQLVSSAVEALLFWFQVAEPADRREAVEIVGMMTADRTCEFGKESNNKDTWAAFLSAANDDDVSVRLEFVKQSRNVITSNHTHLRGHVINCLIRLAMDSDDEVRAEVVRSVTDVAKYKLENLSDKILRACADRMKDKQPTVRIFAIKCLMDLYCHVMTASPLPFYPDQRSDGSAVYTESDKQCVRFIPTAVFYLYRLTQRNPSYQDSRLTIERYVQLHFVPYRVEAKKRVKVMMDLLRNLDDIGVLMFADVINRSAQLRRAMIAILCQISNSSNSTLPATEFSAEIKERIRRIVKIFPEAVVLEKVMMTFVNQMSGDEEMFRAVKQLMADSYRSKEISDAAQTIKKLMGKKITAKTQITAFAHFIDRISPLSFDVLAAKELVETVCETVNQKLQMKKWAEECVDRDLTVLRIFTEHFGHLFVEQDIVEKIRCSMLNTEEPVSVEAGLGALLKIFQNSTFRKKLQDEATRKERWFLALVKNLKDFVMRTDPFYRRSCKLSARLLVRMLDSEAVKSFFTENLPSLMSRLSLEAEGAANAFQVLGELFASDQKEHLGQMLDFLESEELEQLLTSPASSDDDPEEFNELVHIEKQPWPKFTMAKVYAAKFATKVITSFPLAGLIDKKRMEKINGKLVEAFGQILLHKGDLGGRQCELEKARLRASSAACLLKLAQVIQFRVAMDTTLFRNLSYQITDEAYCVRLHYCHRVKKGLAQKLPIEFGACYGLVNLCQSDEESDTKFENFKAICLNHAQQAFAERTEERADKLKVSGFTRAMFCCESVVAYVVWLLANYPKLERIEPEVERNDEEEVLEEKCKNVNLLAELQESLWMVLEALKHANCNMQKVFKVLEKLKTCGDRTFKSEQKASKEEIKEQNKKLWALADLGIQMMTYRAKVRNEDVESKEDGYNLQFFYTCTAKEGLDPSNVFAPDILIKDEQQRGGRSPKTGRVFHVADLIAGFTPPPVNESAGSTTLKNVSTGSKRGGVRSTPKKRKRRGAQKEEEEEDDEEEEVIPISKRRGAPSTSSANGTRKKKASEVDVEDSEDDDVDDPNISLDKIVLSPILDDTSGRTRRSARNITLTSSTPIVPQKPKTTRRKRRQDSEDVTMNSDEDVEEAETSEVVKGSRRRGKVMTPKKKTSESPTKKKTKTSPSKNRYGLPLEEDEEPKSPPKLKTRTSARLSKK